MSRALVCIVVTLCAAGLVRADQSIRSLQQTLKEQGFYYGTVTGEKSAETHCGGSALPNSQRLTSDWRDQSGDVALA